MKVSRYVAMLVAVAVFTSAAGAETAPSVLKQIPAGSMGFAVINNVKATTARVDQFIKDIGVSKFVPPGGVLATVKGALNLGAGFNADGGLAVAMLDPQQFGLDLIGLMNDKPGLKGPAPRDIPVVMFVAGSGVKEVFGPLAKPAGKYFHVMIPAAGAPGFAVHRNGYVVLSPCRAAVDAVIAAKKTAADEMSKAHAAAITKSDLAYHVNMKVAGPIANAALKTFEKDIAREFRGGPMDPTAILALYRELIDGMDAISVTASLESKGVAVDFMVGFSSDSPFSKLAAAFPGTIRPTVNRLANLPYVLAVSSVVENSAEASKLAKDLTGKLFGKAMPKEVRDALAKMVKAVTSDQITSINIVAGGAPQGSGVFGLAALIECKDTKAVKTMLAGGAGGLESFIKSFNPNDEDLKKLKIAYSNNITTIGNIAVDAITVTHPDLDGLSPRERGEMTKVFGEDKILIRVAAVDTKTVVATFGGSSAFLTETIKAAKTGGRIVSRKDAKALARHMPAKPTSVTLLSIGNLFEVINTGMKAYDPDAGGLPVKISTKDPIVISEGYTGKASHVIVFVPTKLIKDVVGAVNAAGAFFGGPPPRGGVVPVPPGGDF